MRKSKKATATYYSPFTVALSRIILAALTLLALYAFIRYFIPWLWQHLWKIVSLPLIPALFVAIISLYCKLAPVLYKRIVSLVSYIGNSLLYPVIFTTHSPCLYSLFRPSWAAPLLLKLPAAKRVDVLIEVDKKIAVNILRNIEMLSEREFVAIMCAIPQSHLDELMYLESFQCRKRMLDKAGIVSELSKDKKLYASHGNHS